MVNLFVVSSGNTVMINISQEILKIFHEKILKTINFY